MRLLVEPLARDVQHPGAPWLKRPLRKSVGEAAAAVVPSIVGVHLQPVCFDWLSAWKPRGSTGWMAGTATDDFARLKDNRFVAATVVYGGGFSFWTTIPLLMEPPAQGFCAYEHLWAGEVIGQLAIAARFYAAVPAASLLRCDLALEGLDGAVSWWASHGRVATPDSPTVADARYQTRALFSTRELQIDPRDAARQLLDPLFASFVEEGYDVVGRLSSMS